MSQIHYDAVIVGGGLVGNATALALSMLSLRIAMINPSPIPESFECDPEDFDRRAMAMSLSSVNILKALGIWSNCLSEATAIRSIHVSEKGRYGKTRLQAKKNNVEQFGFVINMAKLYSLLEQKCLQTPSIEQLRPNSLTAMKFDEENQQWHCHLQAKGEAASAVITNALIACDGSRSFVREQLGIASQVKKLTDIAVVANVQTTKPLNHTAYQRFTQEGPVALLPIGTYQATAVVTTSPDKAELYCQNEKCFQETLQHRFGYRLGRFEKIGKRQSHPLIRLWADKAVAKQAVLLGNAAHTLHPVAAQGFNLSLRDIASLAELIASNLADGEAMDWQDIFNQYEQSRLKDQTAILGLTENLLSVFGWKNAPVAWLRSFAMHGLDHCSLLKNWLARLGMGMNDGSSQRLIYGKPLSRMEQVNESH